MSAVVDVKFVRIRWGGAVLAALSRATAHQQMTNVEAGAAAGRARNSDMTVMRIGQCSFESRRDPTDYRDHGEQALNASPSPRAEH